MAAGERRWQVPRVEELLPGTAPREADRSALRIALLVALVAHGILLGLVLPRMGEGEAVETPPDPVWVLHPWTPPPRPVDSSPSPFVRVSAVALPEVEPAEHEPVRRGAEAAELGELDDPAEIEWGETFAPPARQGARRWATIGATEPRRIEFVEPDYPWRARTAGIQGEVVLDVTIDEHGFVSDIDVLRPLPHGLTEAAAEAVRRWRYEPATVAGRPVPVLLTVHVRFRLE